MFMNVFRLWGLRVPFAFLLSTTLALGPPGIWYGMFISNTVMFLIGYVWMKTGRWMHQINPDEI